MTIRKYEAQVAWCGLQECRSCDAVVNAISRGSPAGKQVSQPLNYRPAAQEVCQSRNVATVCDGITKRFRKGTADENSKIAVVTLPSGIAVSIYGSDALAFLNYDLAVRIHAKGANLVVKRL